MRTTCNIILSLVGTAFILKYGSRYTSMTMAAAVSSLYFLLFLLYAWLVGSRLKQLSIKKSNIINCCIIALIVAVITAVYTHIDPNTLNIDRWSALTSTIDKLLDGEYPYDAVTHLGNHCSTMPAWMLFHVPFHIIGCVGLSLIVGLSLYILVIWKRYGSVATTGVLLTLIACPSFWYEMLTISDLQTNFFMLAAFVCIIKTSNKRTMAFLYAIAVIAGLFLSTRLTVLFPLFFSLMPLWLKAGAREKVLLPAAAIATYLLLLLPFFLWNGDTSHFMESNPYQVQLIQADIFSMVFITSLSLALIVFKRSHVYASSAITLFSFIFVIFLSQYVGSGFTDNLSSCHYDITYLAQAMPFALLAINTEEK